MRTEAQFASSRSGAVWARGTRRLQVVAKGALLGALVLLPARDALAFCRTTTCDVKIESCSQDENGCLQGTPLYWPDLCVTFAVQENGSRLRGISYEKAEAATRRAFQNWISADCGAGRHPSIGVVSLGPAVCDRVEYNHDFAGDEDNPPSMAGPNANLVVFRDEDWPYPEDESTVALTTITFALASGEILDADIELNARDVEFTTSSTSVKNDLQVVLTHEAGHFFGLAHSRVAGTTMNADYDRSDLQFRTLSPDDEAAICAVYGPLVGAEPTETSVGGAASEPDAPALDCTGEGPRYGFSRYCGEPGLADGCSITPPGPLPPLGAALAAVRPKPLRPQASPRAHSEAAALAERATVERRSTLGTLFGLTVPALALGLGVAWRRRRTTGVRPS